MISREPPNVAERAVDDQVLQALQWRAAGYGVGAINDALGFAPGRASVAMWRVVKADLAESGEAEPVVLQGYPWAARARRLGRA